MVRKHYYMCVFISISHLLQSLSHPSWFSSPLLRPHRPSSPKTPPPPGSDWPLSVTGSGAPVAGAVPRWRSRARRSPDVQPRDSPGSGTVLGHRTYGSLSYCPWSCWLEVKGHRSPRRERQGRRRRRQTGEPPSGRTRGGTEGMQRSSPVGLKRCHAFLKPSNDDWSNIIPRTWNTSFATVQRHSFMTSGSEHAAEHWDSLMWLGSELVLHRHSFCWPRPP